MVTSRLRPPTDAAARTLPRRRQGHSWSIVSRTVPSRRDGVFRLCRLGACHPSKAACSSPSASWGSLAISTSARSRSALARDRHLHLCRRRRHQRRRRHRRPIASTPSGKQILVPRSACGATSSLRLSTLVRTTLPATPTLARLTSVTQSSASPTAWRHHQQPARHLHRCRPHHHHHRRHRPRRPRRHPPTGRHSYSRQARRPCHSPRSTAPFRWPFQV